MNQRVDNSEVDRLRAAIEQAPDRVAGVEPVEGVERIGSLKERLASLGEIDHVVWIAPRSEASPCSSSCLRTW